MELKAILVLGTVLKQKRKQKNITQSKLAEICDLHEDYIVKIERGKRQPSISTLFKIADGLNTPAATIIKKVDQLRHK